VPRNLKRYYGLGDLHFITFSCYRRLPLLASNRRRDLVLRVLEATRLKYETLVVGYVVMPEHIHLLMSEPPRHSLSTAIRTGVRYRPCELQCYPLQANVAEGGFARE
jgi:putative transposase